MDRRETKVRLEIKDLRDQLVLLDLVVTLETKEILDYLVVKDQQDQ